MAVTIPTTNQLYLDILTDLESNLGVSIPLFGKSFLRALAAVQTAKIKLIYLSLGDIQKNIFVDLADSTSIGGTLERFGVVKLGRLPFPATAGTYNVTITGEVGAVIPVNTTFKSNDNALSSSKLFILDNEYTLVSTTDTILLRALEAGLESQLNVGDNLTSTAPIALADSVVVVSQEVTIPLNSEDLEVYRKKCIEAFQTEPQGGAATDYRLWSADAQGVQRVYPYAKSGYANEISLYVEATLSDSSDGKGTPTAQILSDVKDVVNFDPDTSKPLNDRGRRPLGVFNIDYLPVSVVNVDITITGYQDLTPEKQTAISSELTILISSIRPFVAGADVYENKQDVISTNNITYAIYEAVNNSIFSSVTVSVGGTDISSYAFELGEIPYFNTISYV
tara:strand:- start:452 stop:1633 length:1182 start_codon:yes stop_codon:yes gene_type:complete